MIVRLEARTTQHNTTISRSGCGCTYVATVIAGTNEYRCNRTRDLQVVMSFGIHFETAEIRKATEFSLVQNCWATYIEIIPLPR